MTYVKLQELSKSIWAIHIMRYYSKYFWQFNGNIKTRKNFKQENYLINPQQSLMSVSDAY